MRLDYFCGLLIEDSKENAVTDVRKLRKFNGKVIKEDGSDFTTYMEEILAEADLIGEPIKLIFDEAKQSLFARVSFHEKESLKDSQLEELLDYVSGQFSDGFGSEPLMIRKGFSRYLLSFDDKTIFGPEKVAAKRPKARPKKAVSKSNLLCLAAMNGEVDTIKQLLAEGATINQVPKPEFEGHTALPPLAWAANRNQFEAAELLIAEGAKLDAKGTSGDTALMMAATSEMLKFLLKQGANPKVKNDKGLDALDYHKYQGNWWLEFEGKESEEYMKTIEFQKIISEYLA